MWAVGGGGWSIRRKLGEGVRWEGPRARLFYGFETREINKDLRKNRFVRDNRALDEKPASVQYK